VRRKKYIEADNNVGGEFSVTSGNTMPIEEGSTSTNGEGHVCCTVIIESILSRKKHPGLAPRIICKLVALTRRHVLHFQKSSEEAHLIHHLTTTCFTFLLAGLNKNMGVGLGP